MKSTVCTFGSPRVGDVDFCRHYNKIVPRTIRFHNELDAICDVPDKGLGYTHVQNKVAVRVNPREIGLPIDNSPHSLLSYMYSVLPDAMEFYAHTNSRKPQSAYNRKFSDMNLRVNTNRDSSEDEYSESESEDFL